MDEAAVAALAGALIGAAGPIAAGIWSEKRQQKRRAQQTALAVAGEIRAVMEIVRKRDYIAGIRAPHRACTRRYGDSIQDTHHVQLFPSCGEKLG